MAIEEKSKFCTMEEEHLGMLLAQEKAYKEERQEQDNSSYSNWEINGVSPWEL